MSGPPPVCSASPCFPKSAAPESNPPTAPDVVCPTGTVSMQYTVPFTSTRTWTSASATDPSTAKTSRTACLASTTRAGVAPAPPPGTLHLQRVLPAESVRSPLSAVPLRHIAEPAGAPRAFVTNSSARPPGYPGPSPETPTPAVRSSRRNPPETVRSRLRLQPVNTRSPGRERAATLPFAPRATVYCDPPSGHDHQPRRTSSST